MGQIQATKTFGTLETCFMSRTTGLFYPHGLQSVMEMNKRPEGLPQIHSTFSSGPLCSSATASGLGTS